MGEGEDQHPVLQAFLHELLHLALTGPDAGHQLADLAEEQLGAQHGDTHQDDEHPQQVGRQHQQIGRCGQQLYNGDEESGDALADEIRHYPDVFLQTVDGISGEKTFPSVPATFQNVAEDVFPEDVLGLHLVVAVPPVRKDDDGELDGQNSQEKADGRSQRISLYARSDIDQVFAGPYEGQRGGNAHHPHQDDDGHPPPYGAGEGPHGPRACLETLHDSVTTPS